MTSSSSASPAGPSPFSDLRGRSVTVMGLGLFGGGLEAARTLARHGARVTVTDLRPAEQLRESLRELEGLELELALGGHREQDFTRADLVVANPAVRPDHPLLQTARAAGVAVTSEAALVLEHCPARLVLVTGTQGKSSTCKATADLLRAAGLPVHLGGNIGRSLLGQVETMEAGDTVVMELSSYQLEALPDPAPACGERVLALGVTNVLADHLERHGTRAAYAAAKARLLELAGPDSWVVLPADDSWVRGWELRRGRRVALQSALDSGSGAGAGLHLRDGSFRWGAESLGRLEDLHLPGTFQRANVLMALGLARAAGADLERLRAALAGLEGLPHRLQDLGLRAGHRVWDNAVSTTPDSTEAALASIECPLTLLVGGQAKDLPLDGLARLARRRARRVIAFGAAAEVLEGAFAAEGLPVLRVETVEQAVRAAFERMEPGEALLFSPACASFDAYRNFEERARDFRGALPPVDSLS